MHWVGRGGDKIELLIEAPGSFVFCVYRECANAGDLGSLQRALHRVTQKCFADPLTLPVAIHR